jgi:hypothetical protein
MAHYAFLDKNNIVTEVIAGVDETELIEGLDTETWYANFRGQTCKRTSYNGKIRGIYAGKGMSYNETEDIFITSQPYPSWIRSGSYWNAPIPRPEDKQFYSWNETTLSWDVLDENPTE